MTLHDAPEYVALTNISPNHLDWHTDEEEYARAKYNIVGKRTKRVVLNADSKKTYDFGLSLLAEGGREVIFFSSSKTPKDIPEGAKLTYLDGGVISFYDGQSTTPILDSAKILLPGKHNAENYMTAISLTLGVADPSGYLEAAESFGGVEHRLELVRVLQGVTYINDSIATSPTRTCAGLHALKTKPIVIAGGYDKKLSFGSLADIVVDRVSVLVLMGATADKIEEEVKKVSAGKREVPIIRVDSMELAVKTAFAAAKGLVNDNMNVSVIFSPACASFDMYKNFEERGNDFKNNVNSIK
jgi:UDP-N-acetylmuramoylalanine--D-glutamate ligase